MDRQQERQQRQRIVDQFSQQAIPFARLPAHLDAMQILLELSAVDRDDTVLDVACGPGLVACAFARHAREVTGLDLTPAMIELARQRQREQGLDNLRWEIGDAVPLPYADDSFSLVLTRYSFHHLLAPEKALAEMVRVCRPGGRVLVADVALEPAKTAAYDRLETLRDPSHTHALSHQEFDGLFGHPALADCRQASYGVELELETQLQASFPCPGDGETVRQMVIGDIGMDELGINARRENGKVLYTVPISVKVGRKR